MPSTGPPHMYQSDFVILLHLVVKEALRRADDLISRRNVSYHSLKIPCGTAQVLPSPILACGEHLCYVLHSCGNTSRQEKLQ
jgi:hypothetical protein